MRWTSMQHRAAGTAAVRLVVFFVVFSLLWITLTDRILGWLVQDPALLMSLATYKGMAYVVLMAGMLGWISYSAFLEQQQKEYVKAPEQDSLGLWAPLTIFMLSAILVGWIGYYAFRLQGIALGNEPLDKAVAGAQLARMARIGYALGVVFLFLAGSLLVLWWKHDQARVHAIRSRLEQETLSLRQQLELLSTYTNDIVMILDEEGHVLGTNDRALETYGYSHEELLTMSIQDLRDLDTLGTLPSQLQEILDKGNLVFETMHRRKDGSVFPVETSARRFEQGDKPFLQSVIRDVTERNLAQRKLQESEDRFRSIFEQADVGMVDCSLEGKFQKANQSFCDFLGYSEGEIRELTFKDVTHPVHREEDLKQVGRMLTGDRSAYKTMKRYLRKDGSAVWGRTSVSLVRSAEGRPLHFIAVIQDINTWRHAEEKLHENEIFVQRVLDTTPNLIYIYDLIERRSIFATRKSIDILGYSPDEMRAMGSKVLESLLHPEDVQNLIQHHHQITSARYPSAFSVEYRLKHAEGNWRWVRSRDVLFNRDKEGKPWQILGSMEDITDQKRAQEELQASESKFSRIFQASPDAILISRMGDGAYLAVNEGLERLTGMNVSEMLGQSALSLGFWSDPAERERWLNELKTKGHVTDMELQFRLPDGREITTSVSSRTIELGGEECQLSIIRDISERKVVEESLRVREERFRALVENTTDTIIRFDREGRHLYVNPSIFQITGMKAEDFLWKTHREMGFPEELCNLCESSIHSVFEGGQSYETEFEFGEGREAKILDWRLFPEFGPDGRVATVLSVARDLTEARHSQKNYRMLFDQMLDGFALHEIICDEAARPVDYRFLSVNPAFEAMTGLSAESVVGRTVKEILPGIEQHWIDTYGRVALTGEPVRFEQFAQPLDRHYHIVAFRPQNGQFACVMMDVSERVRAEREVQRMNEELEQRVRNRTAQLEEANREMEAFSYSVSHDLRAPLRGIDGFSEALLGEYGDKLDEEARHFLTRIRAGTQRMGLLIDDLLKLSQITRSEVDKMPTDLSALVRRLTEELIEGQPGRRVRMEIQEGLIARVDPRLMQTALGNLVGNAWKFTAKTSEAWIAFGRLESEGAFYIRDNGAGFGMQFADKLFVPFQRLHSAQEFEGSGVGLAIVQRIIQRHGGRIWAQGEEGHGATFFFTLPD